MEALIALVVFVVIVIVVAVVGVRLGMLLAPRIDRLTEPSEEEPGGDDD
jgi:NADH:ubiquinone oxidoreductase subunit 3 (subunit A)